MKKTIFLLLLCISTALNGYSRNKQESIKELICITKSDSMVIKMVDSMVPAMMAQMQSQLKDSTAQAKSKEVMAIVVESIKEVTPKMLDYVSAMYDKYFTEKDIKDFIAFYKSSAGQKYLNVMPEMTKDMMGNMMTNFVPELQKSIQAKMEELKNKEKK
ncbi:MAG TPA: DUF2059 domain-containing protein [Paludibacter sp.]|nr:DUF2059 domain-containing protein [Paludibacter sp.]